MRKRDPGANAITRGRCALALVSVLVLAAALRLTGLDWDDGRYLHPDERFLAQVESALDPPASFREYLDTHHSPLNPNARGFGFYVYGTFPLFAVHTLGTWLGAPGNDLDRSILSRELSAEYDGVQLVGRGLSAFCDLVTTLLVFAVGARIYGRGVGLLASALYAVAVLPIQQAHFFTVDAMATMWATAALWVAARAATDGYWFDDLLFGVALGAALACKVSLFPVALLIAIGVVLRFSVQHQDPGPTPDGPARHLRTKALAVRAAISVNVAVIATVITFRLLQPYAFLPPFGGPPPASVSVRIAQNALNFVAPRLNPAWIEQITKANRQQIGDDDAPPNHQWASRTPLLFPWLNMVRFGLGWPLGLVAWLGWAWALVEGLRGRNESARHVLLVAWVGLYFTWTGSGWVTSMRYFLPIYPALTVLAAWALLRVAAPGWDPSLPAAATPSRIRRAFGTGAIAAVLVASTALAWAFTGIYRQPHTRIAASRWIYSHLPAAAVLIFETAPGRIEQGLPLPTALNDAPPPGKPEIAVTTIGPQAPMVVRFSPPPGSRLVGMRFHRMIQAGPLPRRATVGAIVSAADRGGEEIGRCTTVVPAAGTDPVDCAFESLPLAAQHDYSLRVEASVPLAVSGTAIAHEGSWDDAVPMPLPGLEPSGRFAFYALEMAWEDDANKRQRLQHILDRVDYVSISSNRFYDSLARNPRRWPMSLDYYRALFNGTLGFELVADFTVAPTLGPLRIDDQRAEEAFTVYDHPRVMIFRKTVDYDPARTKSILARADLDAIVRRSASQVTEPPAVLQPPPPPRRDELGAMRTPRTSAP